MEEIKAWDIMLGNYITDIHSPKGFFKVTEIHKKTVRYGFDYKARYEDLRGIPITEDILLKAGFRKRKMSGYDAHFIYSLFIGGETIGITAIYNADFSIMLHGVARGVKHLHRLQNIIKIVTGNELEINL